PNKIKVIVVNKRIKWQIDNLNCGLYYIPLNLLISSIKLKRVIRSSLALEIYSIVIGINIGIVLRLMLKRITKELGISSIKIVVYTNSFSLYKYLVKLRTTKEKRLIIDIIGL
ncbi:hypothetical protein LCER1_G005732, partial [Lachnellula cervina]